MFQLLIVKNLIEYEITLRHEGILIVYYSVISYFLDFFWQKKHLIL